MTTQLHGPGIGLRPEHYTGILAAPGCIGWLEVLTDNYLVPGGKPLHYLERVRRDHPLVMHGVAMNLGSTDPLDTAYLRAVRQLATRIEAHWVSDHLCWTGVDGARLHDLLPLPFTEEAAEHVAGRIRQAQDILGRRLLIENLSAYVRAAAPLDECEFVREVAERADCELLVDINNVYVSARNGGFDPLDYLRRLPARRVRQLHLAGHNDLGDLCIDTHDRPVCDAVWELYRHSVALWGAVPVSIERDEHIPPLDELLAEAHTAGEIQQRTPREALHAAA